MRLEIRRWNFIRLVRLVVGIIGTVQGIVVGELALSIFAFLLVYMALAVKESEKVELELEEVRPRI